MRLLFFLLFAIGCHGSKQKTNMQSNGKLVLVDSTSINSDAVRKDPDNTTSYYPIFYIGKQTDTIYLGCQISRYTQGYRESLRDSTLANLTDVSIAVDTSFKLGYTYNFEHYDEKQKRDVLDSTKTYPATAIIVRNNSDSLFYAGIFAELGFTVMQAKNELGKWVDIEKEYLYFCGTGARKLIIEPKQIMIAKLIRYKGDFTTSCRLKFSQFNGQTLYSNVFINTINKSQLKAITSD